MPVIPATREERDEGMRVKASPDKKQDPISTNKAGWWYTPVISAIQEAQAGGLRSQAKITRPYLKNNPKQKGLEVVE
jgi:hypothetical protein